MWKLIFVFLPFTECVVSFLLDLQSLQQNFTNFPIAQGVDIVVTTVFRKSIKIMTMRCDKKTECHNKVLEHWTSLFLKCYCLSLFLCKLFLGEFRHFFAVRLKSSILSTTRFYSTRAWATTRTILWNIFSQKNNV